MRACEDAAPVVGRMYCKLVYVEQQKIGERGVYYCEGQGAQREEELHNWSKLVRVKTAEECVKPPLPKSLHAIQGQKATVVNENGDMLRVKVADRGDKIFRVGRGLVEFLPPDVAMATAAVPPREEARPAPKSAAEQQRRGKKLKVGDEVDQTRPKKLKGMRSIRPRPTHGPQPPTSTCLLYTSDAADE